ncbi:MAG: RNA polymerase subunit sigma-70 [Planctomycetota bacterium]|nr:MAG: RNA polymerase subunit sigma-70 [Planctomycetota bacterium]REJ93531.1 MAG: RNA polymerase subunit sigma-70 [Planctomycetota bacterium]
MATATAQKTRPTARLRARTRSNRVSSERLKTLRLREITFIPCQSFRLRQPATVPEWTESPHLKAVELGEVTPKVPKLSGFPAHLMRMCETPILEVADERLFFRRMNYLKFRAHNLRDKLKSTATSAEIGDVEAAIAAAERIRNYIIQANTRLVISIAKKFSDATNDFDEMLSQGITSLMNSVEKFDFDRGFRFSTYATTVIQRDLYRLVVKNRNQRTRFNTGAEEVFAGCAGDQAEENRAARNATQTYGRLTEMIERLDPREMRIIRSRFGFDTEGGRKETYTSLGKELGISKERVRQLAERALAKLRKAAPEFGLAARFDY